MLFETSASDRIADDTVDASDVLVRDLRTGTNSLVSAAINGLPGLSFRERSRSTLIPGRECAHARCASYFIAA